MYEEQQAREISVRDFLRVIFRRKWILITLFTVSTTAVAVMNIRSPVLYESQARVLVRRGQMENAVSARYRYLPWEEEISSELETVKSQTVLRRGEEILKETLEDAGLDRRPLIVRRNVNVEVVMESNVLAISYLHSDPDMAQLGADAVSRAYMEHYQESGNIERVNEFFATEIEGVEGELDELRAARGEFLEEERLTFSNNEQAQLEKRVDESESRLKELRQEIAKRETLLETQRRAVEDGFETRVPKLRESSYGDNSVITQTKLELAKLKAERDAMAAQYTEKYPPLAALNKRIKALESQLRSEVLDKINLEEMDLEILRDEEQTLAQGLAESEGKLLAILEKQGWYRQMELDLETLEDRYRQLKETEIQTKISQATSPDWRVTLLTPASEAVARKTKDYVRMALAPIFSLVIGLGLVFFVESLDHSIKTPADAEEALGIPVLASLWEIKKT
jgi:uncharacterized protein involved in exopolysaccharide biosynthesis